MNLTQVESKTVDKFFMVAVGIVSIFSVVLFCLCAYQFIGVILRPLPLMNLTGYSRTALRVQKTYQIFSWGLMTFVFLFALVLSFSQVYTELS